MDVLSTPSDSEEDTLSSMDSEGSSGEESEDDEGSMTSSSASSTFCTSSSSSFSSSPSSSSDTDQQLCVSSDDECSKLGSLCKSLLESKTPLYPDSQVTILDSYILLYEYSLRHSLTKEAFKELLQLITIHMPLNAKSAKSVYLLQGFFEKHFNDTKGECFYYCSKCHRSVDEGALCPSGCSTTISKFLYVPIEPQLKRRLEDPFVWNKLQLRLRRESDGSIHDIYDGSEYKKYVRTGFLSSKANVSLLLNTDGVQVFTSSKREVWPIWLAINELPPNLRFSKQHMLLAGLWFDTHKPTMSTFLYPLMTSLNRLYLEGIEIDASDGRCRCHAALLLCCIDLPAQAQLLNMKFFNGKNACAHCEEEGVPRPSCPRVRNWPYAGEPCVRTHSRMLSQAREAITQHKAVVGIKGATVLSLHRPYDISRGIAIDDLHAIFLGVTLDLLRFWFDTKYRTEAFSLRSQMAQCNEMLLRIQVPDTISRTPRSLLEFEKWKGSQLREWLLFFSLPVLTGKLPRDYLKHFSLLIAALHILLADTISPVDLSNAESFLKDFYIKLPQLYGPNATTHKVHLLSHAVACVRRWGPLWAYSTFHFEGMNHQVKKLFHGSQDMNKQLAFNHLMLQIMPSIIALRGYQSTSYDRTQRLLDRMRKKKRKSTLVGEGEHVLGVVLRTLSPTELAAINLLISELDFPLIEQDQRVQVASRLITEDGTTFYSTAYKRVRVRNSYTVQYSSGFGQICCFVALDGLSYVLVLLIKLLQLAGTGYEAVDSLSYSSIKPVTCGPMICIPSSALHSKCVFIGGSSISYVASFPYSLMYD